jgi:hypothetical protein
MTSATSGSRRMPRNGMQSPSRLIMARQTRLAGSRREKCCVAAKVRITGECGDDESNRLKFAANVRVEQLMRPIPPTHEP